MDPKDHDIIQKIVEPFTDINVTGWSVMRNTLVNPLEHLERGLKNISTLPPLSMITPNITVLQCHHGKCQYCRKGRPEPLHMDKRNIVHKGKQSISK